MMRQLIMGVDTNTATWIWVRHAPSGMPGRFCGQSDPGLDTATVPDYRAVAGALPKGCRVFVSPFVRATQTFAKLVQSGFQPGMTVTSALIAEQNFGQLDGERYDAVPLPDGAEALAAWEPPGGESFNAVAARVRAFLEQQAGGGDAVVISHAGPIRAALAGALGIAPAQALAFTIEPLSRTAMSFSSGGHWQALYVNRTAT